MSKYLFGKTVLITRPLKQARALAEKISECGGKPLVFPTLEILPLADKTALHAVVQQLSSDDIAVFVSANAVDYGLPLRPEIFSRLIIIAVGSGTARSLEMHGVTVNFIPQSHRTEGILELPVLQNVSGKKVVIFCGENSRPLLKETLKNRGAQVEEAICYRRQCPIIVVSDVLQNFQRENIHCIISTSAESLSNLWRLLGSAAKEWLQAIPILVISSKMAEQAKQFGFHTILSAPGASDEAILKTLPSLSHPHPNPPPKRGRE